MSGVSHAHTSVPRWEAEAPTVDTTGSGYLVLGEGPVVADWLAELAVTIKPVQSHTVDLEWLADRLGAAAVGIRVMATGPELEMLDVIRCARAAGLLDCEMRIHVTVTDRRRVYCSHCLAQTVAVVEVGDLVDCSGCGRHLLVYHHVSRSHGAYMGFMVDAEEPDAGA